jgi:hypothetical protein
MGNIPVLKPSEVVAILAKLGIPKFVSADHTSSFAIQQAAVQRFHFIRAEIFLRSCFVKLQGILVSQLMICSSKDSRPTRHSTRTPQMRGTGYFYGGALTRGNLSSHIQEFNR